MAATTAYYTPASLSFLRALARNNSREWFTAHKSEFEQHVRQPSLRLIADLAKPLQTISAEYIASPKPVGGSLFRIHRDTRFAADKTPYKTHVGMRFYHAATAATARGTDGNAAPGRLDAPVFYLHVEPGASFAGGGIWHPQPDTLKRIRNFLLNSPVSWKQATQSAAFRKQFALGGDSLSRPPRGYDPEHPMIEDLKRKDFVASSQFSDEDLMRPDLAKQLIKRYQVITPMIDWLCGALDLEF